MMRRCVLFAALLLAASAGGPVAPQPAGTLALHASSPLIVTEALGETATDASAVSVRYAVASSSLNGSLADPYEAGTKSNVTSAQIEDVVARFEAAGIAPGAIQVARYRPFSPAGAPLGVIGVVTVTLSHPTPSSMNRLYGAGGASGARYLGTLSSLEGCDARRQAAIRTARRSAATVAAAAARALNLSLTAVVHSASYPIVDTPSGYSVVAPGDVLTRCAGRPLPPVQNVDALPLGESSSRAKLYALAVSAYRATLPSHLRGRVAKVSMAATNAATAGPAERDAMLRPAPVFGEPPPAQQPFLTSSGATRYYSGEKAEYAEVDLPAAWLVTVTPNGAPDEAVRTILRDMGVREADMLLRVTPQGVHEVTVRSSLDRPRVVAFLRDLSARALRGNVPVSTRTLAFVRDCGGLLGAATAAAAYDGRNRAVSFARDTGLRLGPLAAVSVRTRPEGLHCGVTSTDLRTLAATPDPASDFPSVVDSELTGRIRATVHVDYALEP